MTTTLSLLPWVPRFVLGDGTELQFTLPVTRWVPGVRNEGSLQKTATGIVGVVDLFELYRLTFSIRFTEDEWPKVKQLIAYGQSCRAFAWYHGGGSTTDESIPTHFDVTLDEPRVSTAVQPQRDPALTWLLTQRVTLAMRAPFTLGYFSGAFGDLPSISVGVDAVLVTIDDDDELEPSDTTQAHVMLFDRDGNELNSAVHPVVWSSTDEGVAIVNSSGVVTAIGAGTCEIVATSEGVSDSVTVTVTEHVDIDTIIGATPTVTQTTDSLTMAVPDGAQEGDKLVVVLRCRVDRTFTAPGGWSLLLSTTVPSPSTVPTGDTRVYILTKAYASESTVTFTQSANAACAGMVVLVRGTLGTLASSATSPLAYTKTESSSCMLVFTFDSNFTPVVGTPARVASPSGYTQLAYSHFLSAGSEFYAIFADHKNFELAAALSLTISWPGVGANTRWVAAVEVLQP